MNHPNTSLVLCGVIAGVVAAAHAESVYVQVQGNDIGRGVVVSLSGGLTFADGSASKTVWAGQRSLLVDGQLVRAFSAELTSRNGDGWYQQGLVGDSLGDAKARAIGALFADQANALNSRNQAATFQAMLWELVYDFDGSEQSIDMHQGHIAFGMLDGALFDSMKTTALRGGPGSNLSLLSSDLHTDHFRVVPLPSGASLAGLGLLLAGARRCRRS